MKTAEPYQRPYWHVDVKWLFGLILTFTLATSYLLTGLFFITTRDTATNLSASLITSYFSHGSDALSDQRTAQDIRTKMDQAHSDTFYPFEGLKIAITRHNLDTMSIPQIKHKIFLALTTPLYDQGVQGFATSLTDDPEKQKKFANDATLLGFFTAETHQKIFTILAIALAINLFFAAGLVYFSYHAGRVVSPGVVLVVSSLLGLIITTLGKVMLTNQAQNGFSVSGFSIDQSTLSQALNPFWTTYLVASALGVILIFTATVLKVFFWKK